MSMNYRTQKEAIKLERTMFFSSLPLPLAHKGLKNILLGFGLLFQLHPLKDKVRICGKNYRTGFFIVFLLLPKED